MNIRSCQNCHNSSNEEFKPVANLKNSGLLIYIHDNKSKQKRNYGNGNNIILHNTSNRDIKRFDYIVELCQYRTKCLKCKTLIQRVRNVIDDISIINKNGVIGVCDFCKRSHQKNKCKRCQYLVEKFVHNKAIQNENRDEQFRLWLAKLQQILISVLEAKVICKHNICLDFEYKTQLYRLLNSLNTPDPMRQPDIAEFPELFDLKGTGADISENTKILEDLVTKLKYKGIDKNSNIDLSSSSSESESECICKYFVKKENVDKPASSIEIVPEEKVSLHKISIAKDNENESTLLTSSEHQKHRKSKLENITEKPSTGQKSKVTDVSKKTQNRNLKSNKENDLPKEDIKNNNVKKGMEKGKKERHNSEYRLMLQMLKEREKEKKLAEKLEKSKKIDRSPSIKNLPVLKPPKRRVNVEKLDKQISESVIECNGKHSDITEIIKGTEIVHLDSHYRDVDESFEKLPLLYKIQTNITTPPNNKRTRSLPIADNDNQNKKHGKKTSVTESGLIRYELSNREFINKGWTKLPTTKIMRRMNIYKMLPASAKFDWFQNYKNQELLFYPTGERFAEINKTGGGKWFYKNGNVALDAHSAADSNTVKRYVIYSSGEEIIRGKNEPITILACFDYFGNGVVYDRYGNERLKYNQSEGLLKDKKISAPGRWKWHTLNDPPILQQVFIDTYDKSDKNELLRDFNIASDNITQSDEEMIAIELENFVKEKAYKLMQKFKPFQIRIKVLKINNLFSLRIIDQANIFLLFRCDEMIDTDIAEVSEVSTPYDKFPPRSPSLINIQNTLNNIRKRYGSPKKIK